MALAEADRVASTLDLRSGTAGSSRCAWWCAWPLVALLLSFFGLEVSVMTWLWWSMGFLDSVESYQEVSVGLYGLCKLCKVSTWSVSIIIISLSIKTILLFCIWKKVKNGVFKEHFFKTRLISLISADVLKTNHGGRHRAAGRVSRAERAGPQQHWRVAWQPHGDGTNRKVSPQHVSLQRWRGSWPSRWTQSRPRRPPSSRRRGQVSRGRSSCGAA